MPLVSPTTKKPVPDEEWYAPVEPGMYEAPYEEPGQYAAPATAPSEDSSVEPGMYDPAYAGPGLYAESEPLPPLAPVESAPPATEPGMYESRYQRPGQAVPGWVSEPMPVEPGMYEPIYRQPGQYAPRSASTYYGGDEWPIPYTGYDDPANIGGTMGAGPRSDMVQVIDPTTGESVYRQVPSLGTARLVNEGTPLPDTIAPEQTSREGWLSAMAGGGSAPETSLAALGPTALELGYRYQQGDPGVVSRPRLAGETQMPVRRSDLSRPLRDRLAGLFGGGEIMSSQETPLPPGSRRGRNGPATAPRRG